MDGYASAGTGVTPSPWRTWLLLPVWVYGLFVFVNLSQYVWMLAAAASHQVPFGEVASGSLRTPARELIRGVAGPLVGLPLLAVALRFLGPRSVTWSVLRPECRQLAIGAALGSLALSLLVGVLALAGVATVVAGPARMAPDSLTALVGGKLLWSIFKSGLEDVLFIGLLARTWAAVCGCRGAAVRVGVFFGAIHLLNILPALAAAQVLAVLAAGATFGALLTLLAARYRSLWVPIGFHATWNLGLGTVLGATVSGAKDLGGLWVTELAGPAWLTGGKFGVEASWVAVLVTGGFLAHAALGPAHTRRSTTREASSIVYRG
jgi:hypothetical protein